MISEPLISVVIPVYNCEAFVSEAIESVFAQAHSSFEVIVVDDGSTDSTPEVLAQFGNRIEVVTQENRGQSAARNVGIRQARGEYIGLLDADDLWTDVHTSSLLPVLVNDNSCLAAIGHTQYVKSSGGRITERTSGFYAQELVGAGLYRSELFSHIGFFDETMRHGEDLDWKARFSESGLKARLVPETVFCYRRHENNMTNVRECVRQGHIDAIRRKVARARHRQQGTYAP